MRLVLLNPHIQPFGISLASFLFRQKQILKYSFVLSELIKKRPREVVFFVDGSRSSFDSFGYRSPFFSKFFSIVELYLWGIINRVHVFRYRVVWNIEALDPRQDVIFTFVKSNLDGYVPTETVEHLFRYEGLVAAHFSHYYLHPKISAEHCRKILHALYIAEGDLNQNDFFRHYFGERNKVYVLPFVVRERYKNFNDFENRANKCVAIGSFLKVPNSEFNTFYQDSALHPLRRDIYLAKDRFARELDNYIVPVDIPDDLRAAVAQRLSLPKKFIDRMPYIFIEKFFGNYKKRFFSFDIVQKYNQYKMFASADERTGVMSINTVEGMACGCALVAPIQEYYEDLGLVSGENYIGFSGGIDEMIAAIRYYQSHPKELARIANAGFAFTQKNLTSHIVAERLWQALDQAREDATSSSRR